MNTLRIFFRLAWPYWRSRQQWVSWLLLGSVIAMGLLIVQINVWINAWSKTFYDTLGAFDTSALYRLMGEYVIYLAAFVLIAVYKNWLHKALLLRWRQSMTEQVIGRWLDDHAFYRIGHQGEPDNPDQRIAEDIKRLVESSVSLLVSFITNFAQAGAFLGILWQLSGTQTFSAGSYSVTLDGYLVWIAAIYTVVGTAITHWIGRPLHRLNYEQQHREADLRADLLRKRDNAEQIALYRGETVEAHQLKARFARIADNWRALMNRERDLNFFTVSYDRISLIIPVFAALPAFLAKTITLGGLMQIRSAFGAVQNSLSWFIGAYRLIMDWSATVERLGQFHNALEQAHAERPQPAVGSRLQLRSASVLLPNGNPLLEDLSLNLQPGTWLRLAGPSGLGKSTLLRTLGGVWPFHCGHWQLPPGRSLLLPQKAYLATDRLDRLLAYPSNEVPEESELREILQAVGLGVLQDQLERETEWPRELSGGEQQRLAFARALLYRPDTLYLDEATSQLDEVSARSLLLLLRTHLPQCSVIAVSHQPAVQALFEQTLDLQSHQHKAPAKYLEPEAAL
ncbi:ABC transporter ATP-binding protein/permease [Pseudomonas vanderleydeniana]|uniref:ABC transporter ATP-binding protein/permease n=1 Tax=Pseudomonas vanderleydeniana TaxID=2745495 RepID=A0A9E6PFP9_9PSED|nr:ABC transporter ATP-binding protein/permease [Pseudomonas vanderleydeniana]QXI25987.1 ABC transporter ATP-binding protein/permease [Pseudomonas vanderleydeniana]